MKLASKPINSGKQPIIFVHLWRALLALGIYMRGVKGKSRFENERTVKMLEIYRENPAIQTSSGF